MRLLTLTPDLRSYVIAAVAVFSLSCAPAAALVQSLWQSRPPPAFLPLYAATLLTTAAGAVVVLRLPGLTQGSSTVLVLAILVGLAAGEAAFRADGVVRRALRRRVRFHAPAGGRLFFGRRPPTSPPAVASPPSAGPVLALLLAIAVLEEVLYRGVLVDLSLELPLAAAVICIAGTVLAFAAAHVYGGWVEVLAKLPLSLAALAASLPFGAVAGAVAAHVLFNTRSWFATRSAEGRS